MVKAHLVPTTLPGGTPSTRSGCSRPIQPGLEEYGERWTFSCPTLAPSLRCMPCASFLTLLVKLHSAHPAKPKMKKMQYWERVFFLLSFPHWLGLVGTSVRLSNISNISHRGNCCRRGGSSSQGLGTPQPPRISSPPLCNPIFSHSHCICPPEGQLLPQQRG